MVTVDLKGIHKVKAKGKTYYYAWRGGPRLKGAPGDPEFLPSYNEAIENRRIPDAGKFRALVTLYRASPDYEKLAASTKKNWSPWLDRISEHFGDLSIAQFDRPERIRPLIRKWRAKYAATPRSADYGMQVLSRILSYAVDPLAKITSNPCEGIKQLYTNDRAAIIWEKEDIDAILAVSSEEVGFAIQLAAHTGLRAGDLFRLSWTHVRDKAIIIATGKSGHKREAVIPLYADLQELLTRIPKRAVTILTNTRKRPWTVNGFSSSFNDAKTEAGLDERNLHFHDLRGTAATKFYTAGLSERVIGEILGWEEESVAKIIRRYVSRTAATDAVIRQLDEARHRRD
ncbi:tyrosine-type recombinase/integrase [Mycoplana ramosa]|uniref:Tyrosine-type recombinase/integrase n=1 Tax=Mycoplana ramosa TaxID=40837 RepID=A0ABW3YWH0_MYCRA